MMQGECNPVSPIWLRENLSRPVAIRAHLVQGFLPSETRIENGTGVLRRFLGCIEQVWRSRQPIQIPRLRLITDEQAQEVDGDGVRQVHSAPPSQAHSQQTAGMPMVMAATMATIPKAMPQPRGPVS